MSGRALPPAKLLAVVAPVSVVGIGAYLAACYVFAADPGSTTVVPGWAAPGEDHYRLHRLRVLGGTSPQALLELIASSRSNGPGPASYSGA